MYIQMGSCVGALQLLMVGWQKTRKPIYGKEEGDAMAYRNKHDCCELVVLAGRDARCRFTMF